MEKCKYCGKVLPATAIAWRGMLMCNLDCCMMEAKRTDIGYNIVKNAIQAESEEIPVNDIAEHWISSGYVIEALAFMGYKGNIVP